MFLISKSLYASLLLIFIITLSYAENPVEKNQTKVQLVAHAGGGFKNQTYTDSIDALDLNLNDYNFFEIDFSFTSDKKLVCIHDWDESPKRQFGIKLNNIPSYAEFLVLINANPRYSNCTLDSLAAWLIKNPHKKIVTDVKDNNVEALTFIRDSYPDIYNRFIPQIYNPNEYLPIKNLGYQNIILTLYMWSANDERVMEYLTNSSHSYFAVTIHHQRAINLAPKISALGIPVFAHTINDKIIYKELLKFGITGIYTDWLTENLIQ